MRGILAHPTSQRRHYDASMHQGRLPLQRAGTGPAPGWAPPRGIARSLRGELDEVLPLLPEFDRQPIATAAGASNAFLDVIVRREDPALALPAVPVAAVSTRYALLPHLEAAQAVRAAVAALGVHPREMQAEAHLSAYGARMALFVRLPRAYDFDPGDGHPLALRVLCLNSVDGSSTLRMLLGWYRFVCASGLAVGTTRAEWRLAHQRAGRASRDRPACCTAQPPGCSRPPWASPRPFCPRTSAAEGSRTGPSPPRG